MSVGPLAVPVREQIEPSLVEAAAVHLAVDVRDAAAQIRVASLLAHAHLQVASSLAGYPSTRRRGALAPVLAVFLLEHGAGPEIAQRRLAKRVLHVGRCGLVDERPRPD